MNRLAIVILNWDGANDTLAAVHSLSINPVTDKIVVIDNGSQQLDFAKLKPLYKLSTVVVLKNNRNLGFAGGVNTGIHWAIERGYEFVGLLNNDAKVNDTWVKNMLLPFKSSSSVVAVTSLMLNYSGKKIDSTSEQYSNWGLPFPRSRGLKTKDAPESGYVFGATGGATLYKTSLFKEIGLFDETFFAYYEDVDICFRAQLAGHKVYYTNKAIAYHKQGATSKKIPGFTVYQTFKNIPLLYIKNVPLPLLIPIGARLWLSYLLMFGNAIKKGTGLHALKGWLASIWYFWTSALWKRFIIQRRKVVSNQYISSMIYHDLPPDQTGMRKFRAFFVKKTP